jgi:hypothetical protein
MTTLIHPVQQLALGAFQRHLPSLWAERPAQWVAYQGDRRLGFAPHKHELYQEFFQGGLRGEEFVICAIEQKETEIRFGSGVLD